ncbi:hypothetical protein DITRI_Ditri07aG0083900 [Diplodiscus trichospermus]
MGIFTIMTTIMVMTTMGLKSLMIMTWMRKTKMMMKKKLLKIWELKGHRVCCLVPAFVTLPFYFNCVLISVFLLSCLKVYHSAAVKSVESEQPEDLSRPGITDERSEAMLADPLAPRESSQTFCPGNYKTKENDPANSSLPGLEGLVTEQPRVDFGKTTVIGQEPLAPQNTPVPISHQSKDDNLTKTFVHGQEEYPGQPKVNLHIPKGLEEDPAAPKDTPDACVTINYQTKVADPTGKGGEATGMTSILHSLDKTNIYDEQDRARGHNLAPGTHNRSSESSFRTGSQDNFSPEPVAGLPTGTPENAPLMSETLDTTKPQEREHNIEADKSSNQSSMPETMDTTKPQEREHNIEADKSSNHSSMSETMDTTKPQEREHNIEADKSSNQSSYAEKVSSAIKQASTIDYGKKMATTMTEKLTPVYEKVAGAGSTVMSKLHGPGTGTASEVQTEVQEQDKGVTMKGYFAEKLKPSEEDKALSEVISDALHMKNEYPEKETRARGKVTESEEVARRLGTGEERDERAGPGSTNSPTKGVVDKLKGALGSWLGKGEESQTKGTQQAQAQAQAQPHDASYGYEGFSSSTGERRLQESGN